MLKLALGYAKKGWPVFPLDPHGKQPLGRLAPHGFKDATTDTRVVRRWWTKEPEANIGHPTGIICDAGDFDSNETMLRFAELAEQHGLDVKQLPRSRTGRGRHVLFEPTGVGNKVDVIPGMDWRGKGGYIVLPGSLHPSGQQYSWIREPNGHLPAAPDWLKELLTDRAPQSTQTPATTAERPPEVYLKAAIESELNAVRTASEGTRNDQLNRSAFALGQMVGAGWLPFHHAEAELRAAAYACGLEEPEVTRTIRSGLKSGQQDPRPTPESRAGGEIRHGAASSVETAQPATEQAADQPWLVSLAELLTKPPADHDWLVEGLLISGGIGLMGAKPKVGKTTLLHQLALCVARGERFLGRQVQAGPVIYLALEEDESWVVKRFRALGARPDDNVHVLVGQAPQQALQKLRAAIEEQQAKLAIVDPIQRLTRLEDINDYAQVSNATDPLIAIARQTGCAFVFSHHLGKLDRDSGDQILGSTALFGSVDVSMIVRKAEAGVRTLETIQRYGQGLDPVVLGHDPATGASWLLGALDAYQRDQDRQAILDYLADQVAPVPQQELFEGTGLRWQTVAQQLKELMTHRVVERLGAGRRGDPFLYRLRRGGQGNGQGFSNSAQTSGKESDEAGQGNGQGIALVTGNLAGGVSSEYETGFLAPKGLGKETGGETPPSASNLACPRCGKVDYEPLDGGRRRCSCGWEWRP